MERRDLLKAAGAAVLAAEPALAVQAGQEPLDPAFIDAALERFDRRMASLATLQLIPPDRRRPGDEPLVDARTSLARKAGRTFYMTGAFLELDEPYRAHPGVQERIRRLQPEMDEAVGGVAGLLESLTAEERRSLQQQLRAEPDLGGRVAEMLVDPAREDGFGWQRRLDLRVAFDGLARRMRAQNPSLLIDPTVAKVRKLQGGAQADPAGASRAMLARRGEKEYWELQQRAAGYVEAWDRIYETRPRSDLARIEAVYPVYGSGGDGPERTGSGGLRAGAYILGFGVVSELLGAVLYGAGANGAALVFGVTVGPILLAIGLLVVIISAIVYAASDAPKAGTGPGGRQETPPDPGAVNR
ncbi:MAG TPA: hypothetical protein VLW85_14920 [Myxococcales bacterium]|nr:hypothetical protein [Myxococcales bacterium]